MAPQDYPPSIMVTSQTAEEQANIDLYEEYMAIAYSLKANTGGDSVKHLCHKDNWFWAPATFPGCQTCEDYAQSHSVVMQSVSDLHIIRFDQAWAKGSHVLLRYTAEGSHCGKPYKGIEKTGRKAKWAAAAIFEIKDGKIFSFTKNWDQKTMQVRLLSCPNERLGLMHSRFSSVGRR